LRWVIRALCGCALGAGALVSLAAAGEFPAPKAGTAGKGRLEFVEGVPVLHLRGSPEEMGRQHGVLLARQFATLREAYLERFFPGQVERNGALVFGLSLVGSMPPAYVAELKALGEASGVGRTGAVFANTFTDTCRALFCSVAIVSGGASRDGRLLFARNLDFPSLDILHKATVLAVVHHSEKGRRSFVSVGWPGAVGVVTGMNDAGLCLATLVSVSQKGVKLGMPYAMMLRQILEQCSTPQEALKLVERTPRTSANNLAIAAPGAEPLVIEYTPEKVGARGAADGVLLATNHFRTPALAPGPVAACARFETLERLTARDHGRIDVASLEKMLGAVHQNDMTLQSMVFEPAARRLHLAFGTLPASSGKFVSIDCGKLLLAK